MSKLSVIGLETDKADLFDRLMDLGVTELRDQSQKLQEEDWTKITRRDGNEDEVSVLDGQIAEVGTILDMIGRYDNGKKPLFPERKVISLSLIHICVWLCQRCPAGSGRCGDDASGGSGRKYPVDFAGADPFRAVSKQKCVYPFFRHRRYWLVWHGKDCAQ